MPHFMFPGTAALMLRQHSWAGDVAIANALRNYGAWGQEWWLLSSLPGNRHWHLVPARGGWLVSLGGLPSTSTITEPPF
jgi:hypothetical protein